MGGGAINAAKQPPRLVAQVRRRVAYAVVILGLSVGFLTAPAPASGADDDAFAVVQESCLQNEPICRDFVKQVRLEPINGGMRVSWTRGADEYVTSLCRQSSPYMLLGNCTIISQSVLSSFDPVSGTGAQRCTAPSNTDLSCEVTGLRNGVQYSFRIITRVVGPYDEWALLYSPFTAATASPCCSVPLAPGNVQASLVGDSLDVTWDAPTDWGGATELEYEVTTVPVSSTCTATVLACRLTGLDYGVPYSVSVRAKNAAGFGGPAVSAATYVVPKSVPDAPAVVRAKYGAPGSAKVSWTAPPRSGGSPVTGFVATASPGGASCKAPGSGASCTITGLTGGRAYSFTVTASNAQGRGSTSAPAVAGVLVNPASRPREVQARLSGNAAVVSWQAPASNGGGRLVSYVVRSIPDAGTCTTKKRSCTIGGLALGVTYRFTVVAVNTAGRGLPAETSTVTAPAPVAVAPAPVADPKAPAPIS